VDPVSLYIITQPNDKDRLRPLVRIVVNMIVRLLADKMEFENGRPKPTYKHKLLAMIDEFPALGKLEILQQSLAFVAGYGIKCYLIAQDINQLKKPGNRLWSGREHHFELSHPSCFPAKQTGNSRAPLKAHRNNDDYQRTGDAIGSRVLRNSSLYDDAGGATASSDAR
jgi:Type IV secretory system Conjugative DNA transfer